ARRPAHRCASSGRVIGHWFFPHGDGSLAHHGPVKLTRLGITLALAGLIHQAPAALPQAIDSQPLLLWSDEFSTDGRPDPRHWMFENGVVRNSELQWYQPDNARVERGLLVIEARRERKANPGYQAGATDWKRGREFADYTSMTSRPRS